MCLLPFLFSILHIWLELDRLHAYLLIAWDTNTMNYK